MQKVVSATIDTFENMESQVNNEVGEAATSGLKRKLSLVKTPGGSEPDEATANKRRKSSRTSTGGTVRRIFVYFLTC